MIKVKENKGLVARALQVSWPAVLESFFVALVSMVDSFMVSGLGSYAVAAVGLTTQPKFICLAFFTAINMAVSALVARRKGQGDRDSANRILFTAIICCVVGVVIISGVAVALAGPIIHLAGSEPETHDSAVLRFGFFMSALLTANLGTEVLAAHQVAMNAMSLSFSFGDGLQVATVTLIGQSLGQGNKALAKKYGNICQTLGLAISGLLAVVFLVFGRWFFGIFFPNDPQIVELGIVIVKFMILIVLFQVSQVVFSGSLRGAGDVRFTTVTSIISVAIIRPSVSYIAAYALGLGITGIWIGILADLSVRLVLSAGRFKSGRWMNKEI
ncbi:MAG: hypothetical protein IJZ34_13480 [Lachnospiraceae bacterium]|nr:hypothetical protein [Lachnospiraceae bacterium]